MVYDRFVIERPPQDTDEALKLHDAVWDLAVETNLEFGGVINEHHGVGLKLARFVRRQFGAGFQVLEGIKDRIDPHHLLNPGKMGFGGPR
jgi:alkyldihydroxyacetonephosphate synthase